MNELIKVTDLTIKYGALTAVDSISFRVKPGEVLFINGANGSGKSTLLKGIAGLVKPFSGSVSRTSKMSYVPQNENADRDFPATVQEIVLTGTQKPGSLFYSRYDKAAALDSMNRLKISDLACREIKTLSGGQLRRMFLARALCGKPELLLLDEPCAGLDAESHSFFYSILREIRESGTAIVIVTHDESDMNEIKSDQSITLSNGKMNRNIKIDHERNS